MDELRKSREKAVEEAIFGKKINKAMDDHMTYAKMQYKHIGGKLEELIQDTEEVSRFYKDNAEDMLFWGMKECIRITSKNIEGEMGDVPMYVENMNYFINDMLRFLEEAKQKTDKCILLINDYKHCYIDSI